MRKIFHSFLFWLARVSLVDWDWGWHRGPVFVDWYSSLYTEEPNRCYNIERIELRVGQIPLYSFEGEPEYKE